MKIVIAGATGLIGRSLTKDLLESGHSVVALTRNLQPAKPPQHPALQFVRWDGRTAGDWCQSIIGADAVINLSGQSLASGRWTRRRKQSLISSRVDPTNAIVASINAADRKPKVLVNASAVGYYGPVSSNEVPETAPAGSDFMSNLCVEWERSAQAATELGMRVVLLRSGVVLDPKGGALQKMLLPFRMYVGGPLGSGNQWLPWIHKEDEVRAIRLVLENESISGPVNLAAPEAATMKEFSKAIGEALGRPSFMRVPAFVLRAMLGEMADVVLTGQRVVPQKLLQAGFVFQFPSLRKALENLLVGNSD